MAFKSDRLSTADALRRALQRAVEAHRKTTDVDCRNLVHDTVWRRARAEVTNGVHLVDDVVYGIRQPRPRVLFEAASPVSLAVFRPVLDVLSRDPRIEVWFTAYDDAWTADDIFGAAGITERVVDSRTAAWMKVDAYINTDFWNMTWLPRRTTRIHMFHGVAGKYGLDAPTRIAPVVASFDCLMFPNQDRLNRYVAAGLIDPNSAQASLVGYPKTDCLVNGSLDRAAIARTLGLDLRLPTVLYAPTWSRFSSLHAGGVEMITRLAEREMNVVVKLHDRSFDGTASGSGGIDWRARLEGLSRRCRLHVARGSDASPYLSVADVLVTDHSSIGFEFMLLDRPLVVIDCPILIQRARVSPDKVRLLRSAAFVVPDAPSTDRAVEWALESPGQHSAERRAIAGDLFYGAGGATARAVERIYHLLPVDRASAVDACDSVGRGRGELTVGPASALKLDIADRGTPQLDTTAPGVDAGSTMRS
jgi:hypothetical protein